MRRPTVVMRCANCVCSKARKEVYRWYEWPLALILLRPYRCRHCDERFLAPAWKEG